MKMRTAYLKVDDMARSLSFWESILNVKVHKKSKYWSELLCDNINFGLLWTEGFATTADQTIIVDITDHPDKMSYVLADPTGNEFEFTRFRD